MIPFEDPNRVSTTTTRIAGLVLVLLAGVAGWWWIQSSTGNTASSMERAGGPAPRDPTRTTSGAGPGASPLSSGTAALVVPSSPASPPERSDPFLTAIGQDGGTVTTDDPARHRAFRSPLEQSPGYVPPADPESMSVLTGRREAPAVTGEFQGGASSPEALAQLVLDALANTNESQLHEVRVTKGEFEKLLWREFPQSRPITNIQADDAWSMISTSSRAGASKAYTLYAGRKLDVIGIENAHAMEYRNFNLWRDVVIRARDTATGEEIRIDFVPAIAERHGRYKVFSYKD
jgi:hypothetical protein